MNNGLDSTKKLENMPYCGRIVPELESFGYREVIFRDYRIVYRTVENTKNVEILAVLHSAWDIKPLLIPDWDLS